MPITHTIPPPPNPQYLYRVTDSTSHIRASSPSGDFDTGTHTGASWEDIISTATLDRYFTSPSEQILLASSSSLSSSSSNTSNASDEHCEEYSLPSRPFLISTTTSSSWASSEHRRRLYKKRRSDVRTYKIDLSKFEWDYVQVGGVSSGDGRSLTGEAEKIRFPILRSPGWECVVFSTDCATQGLDWWNHKRDSEEWFAVVCIPRKFVELLEVDGVDVARKGR